MESFEDLGLAKWISDQCGVLGLTKPTPVQQECIPEILKGSDVYAAAKTGSGKTAAFALPIINILAEDPYGPFAVVLTPTRELAQQIAEQFRVIGRPMHLRDALIVGGVDMVQQGAELSRRPHIIVATPGRLAAHIQKEGVINLSRIRFLVLDEADRLMTNMTLKKDLDIIYAACNPRRQNLLFSATLLEEPTPTVKRFLNSEKLFRFEIKEKEKTVSQLTQKYVFMPAHVRHSYFMNVINALDEDGGKIIFTSTCKSCEELSLLLREMGHRCVAIHSQMSQGQRLDALDKFKSSFIPILVATDVASRGLDIPIVKFVINFNVPKAVEDYVHRVGRTARAGRGGMAITLVSERDVDLIHAIEEHTSVKLEEFKDITENEVLQTMNKINGARRAANLTMMESGFLERLEKRKQREKEQRQEMKSEQQGSTSSHQPKVKSQSKRKASDKDAKRKKTKPNLAN